MADGFVRSTIDANCGTWAGQPMRGSANSEVLDLRGLYDRCLGNLDLIERVLDKFEQRLPEELDELDRTLELGDAAKIALVAHRIKGSSSNVSAACLQQAAAEIEALSRAGRVAEIPACLPNLREQWQRYVECRATLRPLAPDAAEPDSAPTFARR
jgi:HPt (histidine-containing phosphotransfer) domain-containing protein